ncbi:MAG: TerB family tellurite resistance protein [Rhodospirillum sp.]|nr:TerB family tellurite resistance protein [Rhodospirillum sp.]MCF8491090.1 TerB family tellurite resistance protein [Rhodospirillum sp.]MCF8501957.1 TerB family tellurite resistance protein [Rhodospirillum sp.]
MFDKLRAFLCAGKDEGGGHRSDSVSRAAAFLMVEAGTMDGAFDSVERDRVRALLSRRFSLDSGAAEGLIKEGEAMHEEAVGWYRQSRALKDAFDYEERVDMIEMLWEVAYADGVLDDMEANMMRRVAGLLYVEDVDSGAARKRAMANLGLE